MENERCPFCGFEPTVMRNSRGIAIARCGNAECRLSDHFILATTWNTRVNPETDRLTAENAALTARVERLRTALEHYADGEWLQCFGGTSLAEEALALDGTGKEK